MDLKKLLLIAQKDLTLTIKDRPTLMIMFIAPLVLTTILTLAFSGFSGGSSPIKDIPVAIYNADQGSGLFKFGDQLASLLTTPPDGLKDLVKGTLYTDENAAREQVRQGNAAVAVLIPADFSARVSSAGQSEEKIAVEFFRNAESPTSADIVQAIIRQVIDNFAGASIAAQSAVQAGQPLAAFSVAQEVAQQQGSLFQLNLGSGADGKSGGINLMQFFAPGMAVFFLNFTLAFGAISIMEERERGTLQRMITTPTSRTTVIAGKLFGTYVQGVLQLSILIVAMAVASPLLGATTSVWGTNILGLVIMVLVVTAGSIGVGTLIVALSKDRQQANFIANAAMIILGIIGGTFFYTGSSAPPLGPVSYLSINYWATSAFTTLSQSNAFPVAQLLVMAAMFVVCFGIGAVLFSRRLDV